MSRGAVAATVTVWIVAAWGCMHGYRAWWMSWEAMLCGSLYKKVVLAVACGVNTRFVICALPVLLYFGPCRYRGLNNTLGGKTCTTRCHKWPPLACLAV